MNALEAEYDDHDFPSLDEIHSRISHVFTEWNSRTFVKVANYIETNYRNFYDEDDFPECDMRVTWQEDLQSEEKGQDGNRRMRYPFKFCLVEGIMIVREVDLS